MRHLRRGKFISGASMALGAAMITPMAARAADDYPTRPITIIVPFSPGGPNDVLARLIAKELGKSWNVKVLVENHPGGGTIIGTEVASKARPDGYTLLMVSSSTSTNVTLKKSLPYDTFKDFAPIIRLAEAPTVLVTNPSFPAKSVSDILTLARQSPGKISYGSGGIGTATDLAGRLLCISGKVNMTDVPYKGDGPALIDLLGGRVSWMFGTVLTTLPYVNEGKLRAIAVSGNHTSAAVPGAPTVAQTIPGFEASSFFGMSAPAGTPPAIIAKLNSGIAEILKSPDIKTYLQKSGAEAAPDSPADFANYFKSEVDKWAKVIKEAGIQQE